MKYYGHDITHEKVPRAKIKINPIIHIIKAILNVGKVPKIRSARGRRFGVQGIQEHAPAQS